MVVCATLHFLTRLSVVLSKNLGQTFDIHDYLIERCKSGDSVAQEEIYKRYAKNMLNTSFRILGHQAEAEDVLQDSFLEVFTKMNDYRGESTFGSWLKKIVINRSISLLRKRKLELIDATEVENIAARISDAFGSNISILSYHFKHPNFIWIGN